MALKRVNPQVEGEVKSLLDSTSPKYEQTLKLSNEVDLQHHLTLISK